LTPPHSNPVRPTATPASRPPSPLLLWLWLVPLAIVAWWTANSIGQIGREHMEAGERFRDFLEFYSGAEALVKGTPLYEAGKLGYIYPPLLAVIMKPMAFLPIDQAALIWLAVKVIAVLVSVWFGARAVAARFDLDRDAPLALVGGVIAAIGTALLADKLRAEFRMQQSNTLLLLGWTLALVWLDRRPTLAGFVLGFAVTIKYVALIALPYLLIRRRFRAAAAMTVSMVALALAPALVIGWQENLDGLQRALGGIGSMLAGSTPQSGEAKVMALTRIGCSIPTAMAHFLGEPGLSLRSIALIALVAAATFAGAWAIYARRGQAMFAARGGRNELPPYLGGTTDADRLRIVALEWCGLIVAALCFSPQTNSPHMVQLLPVCFAIAAAAIAPLNNSANLRWLAIASGAVLMAGLTLPPSSEANRAFVYAVHRAGWPCWAMLVSYLLLLAAALPTSHAKSNAT